VEETWKKVNADFGAIMQSLLPEYRRHCSPSILRSAGGVEMRVAFQGVWKESLSELSGGQAVIIGLSFILSLLLSIRPMYILDEIDAAWTSAHPEHRSNVKTAFPSISVYHRLTQEGCS